MPRTATATKTTKKQTSNKFSTVEEVLPAKKSVARTRAMKAHPAIPQVKPKKAPDNRFVASDNPNLLDPSRDGSKKISGVTYRQLADILGFGVGTEQFLVAVELLKGGETRTEINNRVKELLPTHTGNGTVKQVTNLVSGVHNKMLDKGFKVSGSYKLMLVKGSVTK